MIWMNPDTVVDLVKQAHAERLTRAGERARSIEAARRRPDGLALASRIARVRRSAGLTLVRIGERLAGASAPRPYSNARA